METPYLATLLNVVVTVTLSLLLGFPCEVAVTRAQYVPSVDAFTDSVISPEAPAARVILSLDIQASNPVWFESTKSKVSSVLPVFSTVIV